jgi:hypothetical protein
MFPRIIHHYCLFAISYFWCWAVAATLFLFTTVSSFTALLALS